MTFDTELGVIDHQTTQLSILNPGNRHLFGKSLDTDADIDPILKFLEDVKHVLDETAKTAHKIDDDDTTYYTTTEMGLFHHAPITDIIFPPHTIHKITHDLIYTGRDEDRYILGIYNEEKEEWVVNYKLYGWEQVRIC